MIADFLLKNPRILLLTISVIVVAGASSFLVMPRLEDPVLGRRVAIVSTAFPGANARRVESLVTIPLEEALTGISKIKRVRSNSQAGISNIVVELQDEVDDADPVWTLVRNRVVEANASLPEACVDSELHVVPLKAFAAIVALKSKAAVEPDLADIRRLAERLRTRLLAISGTESVESFGASGEELLVEITPTVLASTGLSTVTIAEQIRNDDSDHPAGRISEDGHELSLELDRDSSAINRVSNALIGPDANGNTVKLSTIATVERRLVAPPSNVAIIDGQPAMVLGAMVNDEFRVDQWANRMDATVASFQAEFADSVTIDVLFSQRKHIDDRMSTLLRNLGIGTAAVMLVVLVLMGWRSMIVVATALPLSALMVLAAMRAMAIPIHQMSVTGLIVALGLLIDNAIVMVDEIRARILSGKNVSDAIVSAVRHLAMPLFGSTMTTALAFLPIATLPGPPGEFVGTIAVSVILAITASFILAMTVIPALMGLLGNRSTQQGIIANGLSIAPLTRAYKFSLRLLFRFPIVSVLLGAILPAAGFLAARNLPEQFFPASDRAQIQIEVELPARETIAATEKTVDAIRRIVAQAEQVDRQHWFLGSSAPTFFYNVVPRRRGTPFYAQAFADLNSTKQIGSLVRKLQTEIDDRIPQARVIVRQLEQGPPFDAPVEIRILGSDIATLQSLGSEVRGILAKTSNVIHTRSDLEETIPALTLKVDDASAGKAGLDRKQISGLLYTSLEGAPAGMVYEGEEELPVRVKLDLSGRFTMERLTALPLPSPQPTPTGGPTKDIAPGLNPLTLAGFTTHELNSDVGAIIRINGQRANEVKAYIQAEVLPSTVIAEFKRQLAAFEFSLPDGYTMEFGGETEQRSEAVNKLIANGVVLFALMLLTLVAAFRSFRCAFIVASVGGLSVGLGPLALAWFGYPFGFMAIVGTMGLVGVAINDSIVVLAAIRANGMARDGDRAALVNVVVDCTRHIIATTLTTIVGFLPLIIAGGGFWPPLAITIAGGVGGATFLALYVVPALYLLLCHGSNAASIDFTAKPAP